MVKIKVLILLRRPQPILPTTVCPSTFALHTHADEWWWADSVLTLWGKNLLPPKKYLSQCVAWTKLRTCQKFPVLRNAETENRKLRKQTKGRIRSLDERRGEREGENNLLFSFLLGTRPSQASAPLSPGSTGGRSTKAPPFPPPPLSSEVSATIASLPLDSSFVGWVISCLRPRFARRGFAFFDLWIVNHLLSGCWLWFLALNLEIVLWGKYWFLV